MVMNNPNEVSGGDLASCCDDDVDFDVGDNG